MFTGLIEDVGTLASRVARGPSARLVITTSLGPLVLGESIAVNGVCLTVDRFAEGRFEADCSAETLSRTTLGTLAVGGRVHLERALLPTSRLGGHIVSGHVDGLGRMVARDPVGDALALAFEVPPELARFIAEKGSVALDGTSLTVNGVRGARFEVTIIPHTQGKTRLAELRPGDHVNVEIDLLARYVARLLAFGGEERTHGTGTTDDALLAKLRGSGYLG